MAPSDARGRSTRLCTANNPPRSRRIVASWYPAVTDWRSSSDRSIGCTSASVTVSNWSTT